MIVTTAGHVDHGKTLLLKALTGDNTDRLPEEIKRGMSIDLGFAYKTFGQTKSIGFVDVPGHERFIRNMLAGVTGIDFALLVIAADDGPMPQTIEHLTILDLLGIKRGAIAITKIDKVEPKRINEVKNLARTMLQDTTLSGAQVFPVSSFKNIGINQLSAHLEDQLKRTEKRNSCGNFRLAIDRCFKVKGTGIVVTGSVFSGSVNIGDKLVISPKGIDVTVRTLHTQNKVSRRGNNGQRCALNIIGSKLDAAKINRGDWALARDAHLPSNRMDAIIHVAISEKKSLKHWTPAHLHIGTSNLTCRVAVLMNGEISPGNRGFVQLILKQTTSSKFGDRFILRDQSAQRTIAGGTLIDPFSPAKGRNGYDRIQWLQNLSAEKSKDALSSLIKIMPFGLDLSKFARARNLTKEEAETMFKMPSIKKIDGGEKLWGITETHWNTFSEKIVWEVKNFHKSFPIKLGLNKKKMTKKFKAHAPEFVVDNVIQELINLKKLKQTRKILHHPGHLFIFGPRELILWKKIETVISNNKLHPPSINKLASELGIELLVLEEILFQATQMKYLTKINQTRYFFPSTILSLANLCEKLSLEVENGELNLTSFRNVSGIGRNLSIEVLEFFDKVGFTKRLGERRFIIKPAKKAFPYY